ncbi:aminoglycoside 6-adenylyltransferase [Eubacteriales bacterium OttesenSCG-928-M02]|nr:aminoglycoside 6-adenylyltransferase [Eubacteriales bacterium OttesenSCG-928-M02]
MRTEGEMMARILGYAQADARVQAVLLNGSRADDTIPRDMLQDYDIVYLVENIASYQEDPAWIDVFGPRHMLQMPESMRDPIGDGRLTYLMLFQDNTRMDLTLFDFATFLERDIWDSATIVLLDKGNGLPPLPPASNRDYWITPPTQHIFDCCWNNFWWCTQNVAKGIWRREVSYVIGMLEGVLRPELHQMMDWKLGLEKGFTTATGKMGRHYGRLLSHAEYQAYLGSYPKGIEEEALWEALFQMARIFLQWSKIVSNESDLRMKESDSANMLAHLNWVKNL